MATIVLSAIVAPTASAEQIKDLRACPEAGKKYSDIISWNYEYLPGSVPRQWVAPGVSYTCKTGTSTTAGSELSVEIGVHFFASINAKTGAKAGWSQTATAAHEYSWTNNTSKDQWFQLGVQGIRTQYETYNIVAPCNIVNVISGSGIVATNEPKAEHSYY